MRIKKLNNQGSTLITVIIILAFIGILGSMMLSVTMTNLQMKMIERKSKENFYSCETTLDEIKTGLQELTAKKIRHIYENDILKNISSYITASDDALNIQLKNMVSLALVKDELGDISSYSDVELLDGNPVEEKSDDIFNDYLTSLPVNINRSITIGTIGIIPESGIVITDVNVSMTVNGFESIINTDIVIELKDFVFEEGIETIVYQLEQPYKDYTLVADKGIRSEQSSGTNRIYGSVYAGTEIKVAGQLTQNHSVEINGGNIVTRGDISVEDTAGLNIKGSVWADNIRTETAVPIDQLLNKSTNIDIDGICLVKDDLTLNGSYSNVSLRGAYVGYTDTGTSLGSSIIVNGYDSSLDLSGLDSLILAGRAHVSVDDNKSGTYNATDILTGESVAIKSNQKAYLIPGRFIVGPLRDIYHNPVTHSDKEGNNIPQVDFTSLDPAVEINYPSYLSSSYPYKIASRQTLEGQEATVLYYYFLGFESGKLADDYLREYIGRDVNSLDNTEPFRIKSVKPPDSTQKEVLSAGNLMSYDESTDPKVEIKPGSISVDSSDAEIREAISSFELNNPAYTGYGLKNTDTVGSLDSLYNKITRLLSLDSNRNYNAADQAVRSKIVSSAASDVQQWRLNNSQYEWKDYLDCYDNLIGGFATSQTEGKIISINGDANINKNFTGLMVVNGNVNIADNLIIDGMILAIDSDINDSIEKGNISLGNNIEVTGRLMAMGNINLGTDNTFTASDETLDRVFEDQSEVLRIIFRNLDRSVLYTRMDPAEKLVDLSTIYYRNWRRE